MDVRPFRPCTSADVAGAQASAAEAVNLWAREWLGTGSDAGVACHALDGATLQEANERAPWLRCEGALGSVWAPSWQREVITGLLFASGAAVRPVEGGVAAAVGEQALEALLRGLVRAGEADAVQAASPPAYLRERGRRALRLSVRVAQEELSVLMELPLAEAGPDIAQRQPVLLMQGAIARQAVRVDVRLGESELDLGSLQTLSIGDVLRLDKKLDEGVELHVGDQRLPCIGYLAAHDGDVVIELARR